MSASSSADRHRALLDHLSVAAAILDARGRLLYVNAALERALDRPARRLLGGRLEGHLARGSRSAWRALLRGVEGDGPLDVHLRPGPRTLRPVRLRIRPEGRGPGRVLLAEFVDPRPKLNQDALISSGLLDRAVFRDVSEAIVVCDEKGRLLRANPAACRLALDRPLGRLFDDVFPLSLVRRSAPAGFLPSNLSSLWRSGRYVRCEAILRDRGDVPRRLLVSARPVHLDAHRQVVVVVLTDVNEARRFEEELKELNTTLQRRVQERTANLLLLYDLTRTANEAESAGQALILALQRIGQRGWKFGMAYLRSGKTAGALTLEAVWDAEHAVPGPLIDDLRAESPLKRSRDPVARALRTGRLEISRRLDHDLGRRGRAARRAGLRTAVAVPIRRGTDVLGVLEFFSPEPRDFDDAERATLDAAGLQMGEIVDRKRLQEEFVEAVSHEHERIRRELHDSVGQELTGLSLMMHAFPAAGETRAAAVEIAQGIQRVLRGVHELSRGVFPAEISTLGLAGALARLAEETRKRSGLDCRFQDRTRGAPVSSRTSLQAFRIAQEAVNNAVKHSRGRRISISLSAKDGRFRLAVQDDGRGLRTTSPGAGAGLRTMRFRAEAVGGALQFGRLRSGGTRVSCVWKG